MATPLPYTVHILLPPLFEPQALLAIQYWLQTRAQGMFPVYLADTTTKSSLVSPFLNRISDSGHWGRTVDPFGGDSRFSVG